MVLVTIPDSITHEEEEGGREGGKENIHLSEIQIRCQGDHLEAPMKEEKVVRL